MRRRSGMGATSLYKAIIESAAREHGLEAVFEHRFHPTRRWRFDAAIPELMLGIEIDGAVWTNGRHTRGAGFLRDQEKFREAAILGWRVLRFSTADITSGCLADDIERAIATHEQREDGRER